MMALNAIIIPMPYGLTFKAWGALAAEPLAQYGVAEPLSEDDWKSWVCALFYVQELTARNIPSPEQFTDWQTWADRFIESVG